MKLTLFPLLFTLLGLVTSTPVLKLDIQITDDALVSGCLDTPNQLQYVLGPEPAGNLKAAEHAVQKGIGWVVFKENYLYGYLQDSDDKLSLKGKLNRKPFQALERFDNLEFTFESWSDFEGAFIGVVSWHTVRVTWESGASIYGFIEEPVEPRRNFQGESSVD